MTDAKTILLRTHADASTGFGHLVRLLTIGESLKNRRIRVRLAMGGDEAAFVKARELGYQVEPHANFSDDEAEQENPPDAILVDSYLYDAAYLDAWRKRGVKIAIIDDLADRDLIADLVVNPNVIGNKYRKVYKDLGCKLLLLGAQFVIIRPEVVAELETPHAPGPRLLVIFGASDIGGMTSPVVTALSEVAAQFSLDVVVGPDAPTLPDIEQAVNGASRRGRETVLHVSPPNLPHLMAQASLAVSAGGVTASELACLGVPAVLITVAANQLEAAQYWEELNVHRLLPQPMDAVQLRVVVDLLLRSPILREAMGRNGANLIDGKGATRVANEIAHWLGENE